MASFDPSPYCVPGEITVHEAQHDLVSNVEGYKDLMQQLKATLAIDWAKSTSGLGP